MYAFCPGKFCLHSYLIWGYAIGWRAFFLTAMAPWIPFIVSINLDWDCCLCLGLWDLWVRITAYSPEIPRGLCHTGDRAEGSVEFDRRFHSCRLLMPIAFFYSFLKRTKILISPQEIAYAQSWWPVQSKFTLAN